MNLKIIKLPEVVAMTALSRSSVYTKIGDHLLPSSINIGNKAVGFIKEEIELVINARIAGRSNNQIKELVQAIEQKRIVDANNVLVKFSIN